MKERISTTAPAGFSGLDACALALALAVASRSTMAHDPDGDFDERIRDKAD